MRLDGERESSNIDDRRGDGGGGGGIPFIGGGGIGIGAIVIAVIGGLIFHINPLVLLGIMNGGGGGGSGTVQQAPPNHPVRSVGGAEEPEVKFVRQVLASTEDTWGALFQQQGGQYRQPTLTLFRGQTRTGCGQGQAAMGPFYCPSDEHVYIDLAFYDTLKSQLGSPGDFAQAYVVAHEVGHHVQKLMGISEKVDAARQRGSEAQSNALSVRLELQADCFAGVWAFHANQTRHILEAGDMEEALNAASQIGDDTLQKKARGTVVPETFTHGTSAQRVGWFKRGFDTGQVAQCDTFKSATP